MLFRALISILIYQMLLDESPIYAFVLFCDSLPEKEKHLVSVFVRCELSFVSFSCVACLSVT